jgi:hypothetical protein
MGIISDAAREGFAQFMVVQINQLIERYSGDARTLDALWELKKATVDDLPGGEFRIQVLDQYAAYLGARKKSGKLQVADFQNIEVYLYDGGDGLIPLKLQITDGSLTFVLSVRGGGVLERRGVAVMECLEQRLAGTLNAHNARKRKYGDGYRTDTVGIHLVRSARSE